MAEPDEVEAAMLAQAMERAFAGPDSPRGSVRSVIDQNLQWDFEYYLEGAASPILRISHVTSTSEALAKASAELTNDIWKTVEFEMQSLGLTGHWVTFASKNLPKSGNARRELARLLALRVRDHVQFGTALLSDPLEEVLAGRYPFTDSLLNHFSSIGIVPRPGGLPAKVLNASDDRLSYLELPAEDVFAETVLKKASKHRNRASELVLAVELVGLRVSEADLNAIKRRASDLEVAFQQILAIARDARGDYLAVRVR